MPSRQESSRRQPSPHPFLGVDGCRAGWVGVALDERGRLTSLVAARFAEIMVRFPHALALVDVPIGLRNAGRDERLCDVGARRVLGARRSSVFPAPTRPALGATDYKTACDRNAEATDGARRLSKQSFAILPKIREVDDYLRGRGTAAPLVREMHPEVCFWGLNGCRPLAFNKKSREGYAERLALLTRHVPASDLEPFIETVVKAHRQDLARDDVVDALVGAVTARVCGGELRTIPDEPERDACGLAMEMVYTSATT